MPKYSEFVSELVSQSMAKSAVSSSTKLFCPSIASLIEALKLQKLWWTWMDARIHPSTFEGQNPLLSSKRVGLSLSGRSWQLVLAFVESFVVTIVIKITVVLSL